MKAKLLWLQWTVLSIRAHERCQYWKDSINITWRITHSLPVISQQVTLECCTTCSSVWKLDTHSSGSGDLLESMCNELMSARNLLASTVAWSVNVIYNLPEALHLLSQTQASWTKIPIMQAECVMGLSGYLSVCIALWVVVMHSLVNCFPGNSQDILFFVESLYCCLWILISCRMHEQPDIWRPFVYLRHFLFGS